MNPKDMNSEIQELDKNLKTLRLYYADRLEDIAILKQEITRLNDKLNHMRKAGEAYVAAAIKYHQCEDSWRDGCHQCFSEYEKAHNEWREVSDE